jgi:hypothetical protein
MTKRLVFLARSLSRSGAERQLVALARGLHAKSIAVSVVVFYDDETGYAPDLRTGGVPLISLKKKAAGTSSFFAALGTGVEKGKPINFTWLFGHPQYPVRIPETLFS